MQRDATENFLELNTYQRAMKSVLTWTATVMSTSIHRFGVDFRSVWLTRRAPNIAVVAFVMALAVASRGGAKETDEQPLQELFQTDTVYPQEKGEVQFTLAPIFRRERGADVSEISASVEYGLTDAWQVEVEWSALIQRNPKHDRTTRGIGDLELGTQYSFLNIGGSSCHAAPRFSVHLPSGNIDKELTEGFVEYEPSLTLAKDFPELHNAQLFAQIGLGFVQRVKEPADASDREPAAHEFAWSAGFFVPFKGWVPTLEFSGNNNRWNHGGKDNQMYLTPGCVWKLFRAAEIGAGVIFNVCAQRHYSFSYLARPFTTG